MPKATATKKAQTRVAAKKAAVKQTEGLNRREVLASLIASADKELGEGYVQLANRTHSSYLLRRPTGITSLDIALAGGFPAAAPSVIVGPDGAGKDYLLWRTLAEQQRIYGDDFCAAVGFTEFKPDKRYMRSCGLRVAFSEDEIEEEAAARSARGLPELTNEEVDELRSQDGDLVFLFGMTADKLFDEVFKLLDANICQVIAVNSIGYLQTEAKEDTESFSQFPQQRNEAMLLSKVLPKFSMYLNRGSVNGRPNETSLLLVNQVRANDAPKHMPGRPIQAKDKYQPGAGAWALKHGKAIELMIHNDAHIRFEEDKSIVLGRKKSWEITKGKLGTHEGLKGSFDYYFDFGADIWQDLLDQCVLRGVMTLAGAHYSYAEPGAEEFHFKANGGYKAVKHLRENPELVHFLRGRCFQEAGLLFRHI